MGDKGTDKAEAKREAYEPSLSGSDDERSVSLQREPLGVQQCAERQAHDAQGEQDARRRAGDADLEQPNLFSCLSEGAKRGFAARVFQMMRRDLDAAEAPV